MAAQLLNVAEYARHRQCDEKAVRKALEEGRITRAGTGRRCIDPEVADIQWAKNTRARADSARQASSAVPGVPGKPSTPPEPPETPPGGYNDHRTRREAAEAERAELETAKAAKRLLDRDQCERTVFEVFRVMRDACSSSHQTTALKVLGLADLREVTIALEDGYRAAFASAERRIRELVEEWRTP